MGRPATRSGKGSDEPPLTALEKSFVFYASYHNDSVNQYIHIIFVWLILYSAFVMLDYTPALHPSLPAMLNWNFLLCTIYALYYAQIERPGFAGYLASAMSVGGFFVARHLHAMYPNNAFYWALRLHGLSWVSQFYGHFVHEGRSPALFQNLFQALAMAPLFVMMEVLFSLGYRPEFRVKVQKIVDDQIATWAREKKLAQKVK